MLGLLLVDGARGLTEQNIEFILGGSFLAALEAVGLSQAWQAEAPALPWALLLPATLSTVLLASLEVLVASNMLREVSGRRAADHSAEEPPRSVHADEPREALAGGEGRHRHAQAGETHHPAAVAPDQRRARFAPNPAPTQQARA